MPDLAIIVPTRGRPGNIEKVIAAWDFTNAWDVADLILAVDADDPELPGYEEIARQFNAEVPGDGRQPLKTLVMDTWLPMVHKLDRVARDLARAYFAVGFAGDDHIPQTIGWAQRYLTVLDELGTGMVYGDDGYQGVKLSTEWAVTADVVRALGRMVPAPVEHMYCDNSMMDLFGGAGALRHLPEVRIEHMHPVAGKAATDAQYQRVNHRDQYAKDRRAYERWKFTTHNMDQDIAIVRSLRGDRPDIAPPKPVRKAPTMTLPSKARRTVTRSGPTRRKADVSRFPFSTEFQHVRGATPDEIGLTLADFARNVPADQEIVELGVFQGRTALIMAWGARQGNGAHVTAIDPWDLPGNVYDPPFTEADSREWAKYRINELGYGDAITLIQDFSHDVANKWGTADGENPVGLLYVDGDHTKEGARRDIEWWSMRLAPGAVIAVDDYGHPDWPGVGEAVDELVAEGFLAPIQLFHDRLAVTRLAESAGERSQRGEKSPEVAGGPAVHPVTKQDNGTWMVENEVDPEDGPDWENGDDDPEDGPTANGLAAITSEGVSPAPEEQRQMVDGPHFPDDPKGFVHEGELTPELVGTPIGDLNTAQLRALAKHREVTVTPPTKPNLIKALRG